jgi:hypothetical protein
MDGDGVRQCKWFNKLTYAMSRSHKNCVIFLSVS